MKTQWMLVEAGGRIIVRRVEFAHTFWKRLAGLQFRRSLEWDAGLLLVPCPAGIHTFCMRFPIDVIAIDRSGKVLAVNPAVRPWRIVPPVRGTHAVLEVSSGAGLVKPGNRLFLRPVTEDGQKQRLPRGLRFLAEG